MERDGARDVGAAQAGRVAAPPAVGVADHRRAGPGAGGRRSASVRRAPCRRPRDRRCSPAARAATTSLAAEVAVALPALFVAVTTTRRVEPMSAPVRVLVEPVAPAMSAQLSPAASQRCHWWPKAIAGVPVHVSVVGRQRPRRRRRRRRPRARRCWRAGRRATTAVAAEDCARGAPRRSSRSTTPRTVLPTSAGARSVGRRRVAPAMSAAAGARVASQRSQACA